jgi:predicted DNA-binding protein with PD1-like motif
VIESFGQLVRASETMLLLVLDTLTASLKSTHIYALVGSSSGRVKTGRYIAGNVFVCEFAIVGLVVLLADGISNSMYCNVCY